MIPRRHFLASSAALSLQAQPAPKKVAAIVTMYTNDGRLNTHANVIIGRLLDGYSPNGVFTKPRTRIVSMFTDQTPPADLSRGLAAKHGFQICNTIRDALTLNGSDLAVDAVCFVGEHGNYPTNDRGQKLYPRYELMERIVEAFRRTGKSVPVFHDKHFSYSWQKAKAMYGWSRELRFPLMAGSSIPLTSSGYGYDYVLQAANFKEGEEVQGGLQALFSDKVNVWEVFADGSNSVLYQGKINVDTATASITLSGDIKGIKKDSYLQFFAIYFPTASQQLTDEICQR